MVRRPGVRVSFDRPYGKYRQVLDAPLSQGSGEFLLWEFPLAFWMEQHGYDISYISNVDTHADAQGLLRAESVAVGWHDEYWSTQMFDNVKRAVDHGVNAGFFSGDTCWGVIPFLPNASGASHRTITRTGVFGPLDERDLKDFPEMRKFQHFAPTEATLIGARNVYPYNGPASDWICTNEKHWVFEGAGMRNGDGIPGLVGFEWMGGPADIPGLDILAKGIVRNSRGDGVYTATIYPGPKGQLRIQCRNDLVGRRPERAARLYSPRREAGGPRPKGPANHCERAQSLCELTVPLGRRFTLRLKILAVAVGILFHSRADIAVLNPVPQLLLNRADIQHPAELHITALHERRQSFSDLDIGARDHLAYDVGELSACHQRIHAACRVKDAMMKTG
jgi:hypothetical protein